MGGWIDWRGDFELEPIVMCQTLVRNGVVLILLVKLVSRKGKQIENLI